MRGPTVTHAFLQLNSYDPGTGILHVTGPCLFMIPSS